MKFILSFLLVSHAMAAIDPEFVSLSELCPSIKIEASYSSKENFTGDIVTGYKAKKAYMARGPAELLCKVQKEAEARGLTLKIFDAYRPVKAVDHFQAWAKKPETNLEIKKRYYPTFTRFELFQRGYIATQSSHSRGGAVDLTLHDLKTEKDLDMGSAFDYFNEISTTDSNLITAEQKHNRMLLKELMETQGFKNFASEWWHFSYKPEPFPNRTFNFDVE